MTTLTPLFGSSLRHQPAAAVRDGMNSTNGKSFQNSNSPIERAAPAAVQPRVEVEQLSADDARALSIETVNLLVKDHPAFVARLIVDAGRRARGELPMTTTASLRPTARAIVLSGEKARGRELSEEEAEFLAEFVEERWPS
jgi:hypothetical protein